MKTNTEEIFALIKQMVNNEELKVDSLLLDEGIIDSLTTIELITALEEKFSLFIESEDLNHFNFNTIENIVLLINSKS
jgi:acyl carrier protein